MAHGSLLFSGRVAATRRGFSLLELILAIGIFAMGLAIVVEVLRTSLDNSIASRELAEAQLLCESKMAELTSGILPLETISEASFADEVIDTEVAGDQASGAPEIDRWLYAVEVTELDDYGLSEVRVTVWRNLPEEKRPTTLTLVRWILDEEVLAAGLAESAEDESGAGATGAAPGGGP